MEGEKKQSAWSSAAKDGLILAAFTIICLLLSTLLKNSPIIVFLVELVKIVGCIWLLRFLMIRWKNSNGSTTPFKYGMMICLFSSVVCAIFTFFQLSYIVPEDIATAFDQIYESFGSMNIPIETQNMLDRLQDNYPQWACVSALISDLICGVIFSGIISSTMKNTDIFADDDNDSPQED